MRQTAIMIMMAICWAAAAAQVLPGDGEGLTIYDLDVEIGDCVGGLCDLSGATVTSETGMRFEYYGDTLVRRVAGPRADWAQTGLRYGSSIQRVACGTRERHPRLFPQDILYPGYTCCRLYQTPPHSRRNSPSPVVDELNYRDKSVAVDFFSCILTNHLQDINFMYIFGN